MAETQDGLQGPGKEYKIGEIVKCLQSLDVVFTENRNILTVLPELIKRFMDLETNITKATGTATSDSTRINHLEKELQEAKKKILDLEAGNKQNDTDVELLKGEHRDQSDKYYRNKFRDLKAKFRMANDGLQAKEAKIAELRTELRSKQEEYDMEIHRSRNELAKKEKELEKMIEQLDTIKQQHDESFRDQKTKIDELQARFKHQEEQHKGDLSLKEMEVNKLKQRLSHTEKEVKRLNEELGQFKSRFAGICEKRVKQDQRKVENILASNQHVPSEVEKDFRDFFDGTREDARDIIQSLYGSEEGIDVHVYYPRIACTILETAYEHANDVKEAVIDLFKVATKNMVLHAPEEGYNFRLKRTEGRFDLYPIPIDELNTSEISTDVLGALLISLKETAQICNLACLEKDVMESSWKKWTRWFEKDESFVHAPTQEVLLKLNGYIKHCIRLTWRMVTQLPPLRLEYLSARFDRHIHKKTTYQNTTEKNPANEESLGEEILCYLWPGLLDGGGRLILQGQVFCKMQREILK